MTTPPTGIWQAFSVFPPLFPPVRRRILQRMNVERLFMNARIYALEREGESFAAMRVGPDGRIRELYPEGAPTPPGLGTVDLGGRAVVPAFIDAHTHFMSKAGLEALAVRLARLEGGRLVPDCLDGVRVLLAERAGRTSGMVMGYGLCLGAVAERRLPRASELDAWLPSRPVIVLSMDGHSSSFSSTALEALGLASVAEDGILSGAAHEFNMGKVTAYAMKSMGPSGIARGLSRSVAEAVEGGLVCVHCLEGTEDSPRDPAAALLRLLGPSLPVRIRLWLQYTDVDRVRRHAKRLTHPRAGGCLAWEMDGSVSSRSAAFDQPYLDRPHAGRLYRDPDGALALVAPFYAAGFQTSAHALGPRGIESILSAYESLMDGAGDRENARRLRIDHFEFPRPDQVERAGKRRLAVAVQPGFAWADARFIHSYEEALPASVLAGQSPLRSLVDAGCVVALSTDAPVQPLDPFMQIAGACDHPVASERLSVYEALRAYSWAGAWMTFEDGERGTLAVGKYADFAVLDRDPFATPADRLHEVRVTGTWHEGEPLVAPPEDLSSFALRLLGARRRRL